MQFVLSCAQFIIHHQDYGSIIVNILSLSKDSLLRDVRKFSRPPEKFNITEIGASKGSLLSLSLSFFISISS